MAEPTMMTSRSRVAPILASASGFILLFFFAMWLRVVPLEPDPVLQGFLQVTTGLLAFIFAAVILVRFQGTQDRISLILGAGFLLSGAILTASSLLFFQFQQDTPLELRWAPAISLRGWRERGRKCSTSSATTNRRARTMRLTHQETGAQRNSNGVSCWN